MLHLLFEKIPVYTFFYLRQLIDLKNSFPKHKENQRIDYRDFRKILPILKLS